MVQHKHGRHWRHLWVAGRSSAWNVRLQWYCRYTNATKVSKYCKYVVKLGKQAHACRLSPGSYTAIWACFIIQSYYWLGFHLYVVHYNAKRILFFLPIYSLVWALYGFVSEHHDLVTVAIDIRKNIKPYNRFMRRTLRGSLINGLVRRM